MTRSNKWYGWIPDIPDHRDYVLPPTYARLPKSVDLRPKFSAPCYDQGQLGSCTGNAVAGAVHFARIQALKRPDFIPSRLMLYYGGREAVGMVNEDSGAMLRDVIKYAKSIGVAEEDASGWPYNIDKFADRPPKACYTFAKAHQVLSYRRVPQTTQAMRSCLAHGNPFVFGFSVYANFESTKVEKTGVVNLPAASEALLGGHATLAMGYDDSSKRFLVRNSWGPDWGINGYFTIPYDYLTNNDLADDFWMVRIMEA